MVGDKEEGSPPLNETLPAADKDAESREWSLQDDLTKLILVRLPANELIGCKLVSKPWCSLVSSHEFISDHIKFSKSDPSNHLLLFHYNPPYNPLKHPPYPFRSVVYFACTKVSVVGSANGLVCIVGRSLDRNFTADDIWILNPVTGHIMKLPLPPKYPHEIYRAKDASFVFWWDSITGDGDDDGEYKLARIVPISDYNISRTVASVWVSSSLETWSEIPVGFDGAFFHSADYASGCDIVVGGFAYWVVFKIVQGLSVEDMCVLSLDLKTLSLSLSRSPFPLHPNLQYSTANSIFHKRRHGDNYVMFAANWKGEFALAERVGGSKMYDVWTMDDVEGWSKKCSFDFGILKRMGDVNGKTVIMKTVKPSESGIVLFDIGTGEAEQVEDFLLGHLMASAHDFVGTLVSVKGFKPLEASDDLSPHLGVIFPNKLKKKTKRKRFEAKKDIVRCGEKSY